MGFLHYSAISGIYEEKNHLSVSAITAPSTSFTQGFATSASGPTMSSRSPISLVNDASKYDGIGLCILCGSLFEGRSSYSDYISKLYKNWVGVNTIIYSMPYFPLMRSNT